MNLILKSALVITTALGLSVNAVAEDAKSVVPARDFYCSVSKNSPGRSKWINYDSSKINVEGKIVTRQAYSAAYIPTWEKEVTYDAEGGYSVQIQLSAVKYQLVGDFLRERPNFQITASVLKDGQVVSKATTESEFIVNAYNLITESKTNLIELNLGLENLLPSAATDEASQFYINCQMPMN